MATTTTPGIATATGTSNAWQSHPRLITAQRLRERVQPLGWSKDDTLFVVLLFAAVVLCAIIPLALL